MPIQRRAGGAPSRVRLSSHSSPVSRKTSTTDFCRVASTKIAGAYRASPAPAAMPTRGEKNRPPAAASRTAEAEPSTAWQMRTTVTSDPSTA